MDEITLKLNANDFNVIKAALEEMPVKIAYQTITKVVSQAQEQLQAAAAPKPINGEAHP